MDSARRKCRRGREGQSGVCGWVGVKGQTWDLSNMNWHCGRDSGLSEKVTRAFSASERTTRSIDS